MEGEKESQAAQKICVFIGSTLFRRRRRAFRAAETKRLDRLAHGVAGSLGCAMGTDMRVLNCMPSGPSAVAGLKETDLILAITSTSRDGSKTKIQPTFDRATYLRLIGPQNGVFAGDVVLVHYLRGEMQQRLWKTVKPVGVDEEGWVSAMERMDHEVVEVGLEVESEGAAGMRRKKIAAHAENFTKVDTTLAESLFSDPKHLSEAARNVFEGCSETPHINLDDLHLVISDLSRYTGCPTPSMKKVSRLFALQDKISFETFFPIFRLFQVRALYNVLNRDPSKGGGGGGGGGGGARFGGFNRNDFGRTAAPIAEPSVQEKKVKPVMDVRRQFAAHAQSISHSEEKDHLERLANGKAGSIGCAMTPTMSVVSCKEGGAAALAGLRVGDLIIAVTAAGRGGRMIATPSSDRAQFLGSIGPQNDVFEDTEIILHVLRDAEQQKWATLKPKVSAKISEREEMMWLEAMKQVDVVELKAVMQEETSGAKATRLKVMNQLKTELAKHDMDIELVNQFMSDPVACKQHTLTIFEAQSHGTTIDLKAMQAICNHMAKVTGCIAPTETQSKSLFHIMDPDGALSVGFDAFYPHFRAHQLKAISELISRQQGVAGARHVGANTKSTPQQHRAATSIQRAMRRFADRSYYLRAIKCFKAQETLRSATLTTAKAGSIGCSMDATMTVSSCRPGSAASIAGILPEDIVVAVTTMGRGAHKTSMAPNRTEFLRNVGPQNAVFEGSEVTLHIVRGNNKKAWNAAKVNSVAGLAGLPHGVVEKKVVTMLAESKAAAATRLAKLSVYKKEKNLNEMDAAVASALVGSPERVVSVIQGVFDRAATNGVVNSYEGAHQVFAEVALILGTPVPSHVVTDRLFIVMEIDFEVTFARLFPVLRLHFLRQLMQILQ